MPKWIQFIVEAFHCFFSKIFAPIKRDCKDSLNQCLTSKTPKEKENTGYVLSC
ncbi:Hypothetical protein Minf_1246 [Methylacidiphilum infernorum V4]|uniref:Uncharacterized protein n=1 Tax=Methylacidiphilum infernorum (isolate V4) TaxID=481448 RepID=B3DVE7_METI4|nr:Hypothetical protein Minf_1246 [Methylacidiphilum infernorum V4]